MLLVNNCNLINYNLEIFYASMACEVKVMRKLIAFSIPCVYHSSLANLHNLQSLSFIRVPFFVWAIIFIIHRYYFAAKHDMFLTYQYYIMNIIYDKAIQRVKTRHNNSMVEINASFIRIMSFLERDS